MQNIEAAHRIVEIHDELSIGSLGTPKRRELMFEQNSLWEQHYEGEPYEKIALDAWLHRRVLAWG